MSSPFRAVGTIVKAHGLKGEVSVVVAADLPFMLSEGLRVWLVPPPAGIRESVIEHVRPGPKGPLVKIAGIDDPDTARSLRGVALSVPVDTLPAELVEDLFDATGIRVTTADGIDLGTVSEVIVTGANDVWVVDGGAYGEVLLPVIDDVLLELDIDERTATVQLLDGLVDEEVER